MQADVAAKKAEMRARYVASERHTVQVDYIPYCDELAALIGCKPRLLPLLLRDPEVRTTEHTHTRTHARTRRHRRIYARTYMYTVLTLSLLGVVASWRGLCLPRAQCRRSTG
jgi:hypothetical protein